LSRVARVAILHAKEEIRMNGILAKVGVGATDPCLIAAAAVGGVITDLGDLLGDLVSGLQESASGLDG